MPQRSQIGGRIRALRSEQGLSQTKLAAMAGISAPYLNLIEHDRRRIGTTLVQALADALGVSEAQLVTGPDLAVLARLQTARQASAEATDQFADRFPGWAEVVCDQSQKIADLEAQIAVLSDRVGNDPELSAALHMVLSTATSIQSSAAILVDGAGDRDWEERFQQNILDDSQRLSSVSRALVAHLERSQPAQNQRSPEEEAAAFWAERDWHLPQVETGGQVDVSALSEAAQAIVAPWIAQYQRDATALPMDKFVAVVRDAGFDPQRIAQATGQPFARVLRRMASLPAAADHPETGLVVTDIAGVIRFEKPVAGAALSGAGPVCSLWPVFQAVVQPGRPIRDVVAVAGQTAQRLTAYAIAELDPGTTLGQPVGVTSTMLLVSDAPSEQARPVGRQCQDCPAAECAARKVPASGSVILPL